MENLSVIMERTKDGFSVYAENEPFAGMGRTEAEAIADMKSGIEFYIETAKERGYRYSSYLEGDYEIVLKYNIPSILEYYGKFITDVGMEKLTGISKTQIWRYTHGKAIPRTPQTRKIVDGLRLFGTELSTLSL
jgi:predicted RNase H-like HicB family nuclease